MPIDTPLTDLIKQLEQAGLRPNERLVQRILAYGPAARTLLIDLACDVDLLHEELPEAVAPLHAIRLLRELPDLELIEALLDNLPVPLYDDEDNVLAELYSEELLFVIGRIGRPAVAALWAYADDPDNLMIGRTAAIICQAYVAGYVPELYDDLIAEGRRRLALEQDPRMAAALAQLLGNLGDKTSYATIMAAYRTGQIDQAFFPAAAARKLLLGGGIKNLPCVHHTLFECYDLHGPFLDTDQPREH